MGRAEGARSSSDRAASEQVSDQVEIRLEGDEAIGLEIVLDGFHGEPRVVGED